jgi:DnaD/phage-associated family protein
MMNFTGFTSKPSPNTPLPGQFFTELLPQIDHLPELKLVLYAIWRLDRQEGAFRFLRRADLAADSLFMQGLADSQRAQQQALDDALERAVGRGVLLRADLPPAPGAAHALPADAVPLYFLNSPRGRAALKGLQQGKWHPAGQPAASVELQRERPNIYRLYETHIGPLTPMLSESLRDAETEYPPDWIEDAIRLAVENNVRKWRYIQAILKSWQEKGRDDRRDTCDPQADRRKYVEGEFAEFIEH